MPADTSPPAPEWITNLMTCVCHCIKARDALSVRVWHEDDVPWHIVIAPTAIEEDGEQFLRNYDIDVAALMKLFPSASEIMLDPEVLSIVTKHEGHDVHILVQLYQEDEEEAQSTNAPSLLLN
jgi:hypothetical protein